MSTLTATCKCGRITGSAGNVESFTLRCWLCDLPRWAADLPNDIRHWPETVRREVAYELRGYGVVEPVTEALRTVQFDANRRERGMYVAYDQDVEGGPLLVGEMIWAHCVFEDGLRLKCKVVERDEERGKAFMHYDDAWAAEFYADPANLRIADESVEEIDLPDEALFAMWDEAKRKSHPVTVVDTREELYRNRAAPRWFQIVEIVDEWQHARVHNLPWSAVWYWLWRPLCNFRERQYDKET